VETVSCDEPGAVTVAGTNDAVAPAGRPVIERPTLPANPFAVPTPTLYETAPPGVVLTEVGDAEMLKSGADVAIRLATSERSVGSVP
jgi:hypothetical protein